MNINKNCKLVLNDVFLYDIGACHYNILQSLGFDISHIDRANKEKRNIQIGLMMKENPKVTTILRETTESLIDEYIRLNRIKEEENIITRQYDGIITTRKLQETKDFLALEFRYHFSVFIISSNRSSYIALDQNNETHIKGIAHRYESIDNVYRRLTKINFLNKESIFRTLQEIKNNIMIGEDAKLYCIPINKERYNVFLKDYGQVEIGESAIKIMGTEDIDKQKYFDYYIRPFTESIVIEYIESKNRY